MNRKLQGEIIARDKECRICGAEKFLTVHHFNDFVDKKWLSAYVTEIPELLITLCRSCHGHLHGKGGGRKKWDTRRALILELCKVDIGPCERHQWICPGEITYCRNCLTVKTIHDARLNAKRVVPDVRMKSPIETENKNCPGLFPK